MSVPDLFGAPTQIDSVTQSRWRGVLARNWIALMGRPTSVLQQDLNAMSDVFSTGVSARSLRQRLYSLPEAEADSRALPSQIVLIVDGCALITPEGRIFLEVLSDMQRFGRTVIDTEQQLFALSTVAGLRSEWYARWLRKQFDSTISPPVLGAALFLLINGSVGESQGLLLPTDIRQDLALGNVVLPLISDFSRALGGQEPETGVGLRQHWAFTQVSRLLGRDVERETLRSGALIYVRPGREQHLLDELTRRLGKIADPPRRYLAVMNFTSGYRKARGRLAAMGQMHEDPTLTRRITERLVAPGEV